MIRLSGSVTLRRLSASSVASGAAPGGRPRRFFPGSLAMLGPPLELGLVRVHACLLLGLELCDRAIKPRAARRSDRPSRRAAHPRARRLSRRPACVDRGRLGQVSARPPRASAGRSAARGKAPRRHVSLVPSTATVPTLHQPRPRAEPQPLHEQRSQPLAPARTNRATVRDRAPGPPRSPETPRRPAQRLDPPRERIPPRTHTTTTPPSSPAHGAAGLPSPANPRSTRSCPAA